MRKPQNFIQWRWLYHAVAREIGTFVMWKFHVSGVVTVDRCLFRLMHRLKRIQARMTACQYDDSWCDSLIAMIRRDSEKIGGTNA